jgi:hypothetical protein
MTRCEFFRSHNSHRVLQALLIDTANEIATGVCDATAVGFFGSDLRLNIQAEKMFPIYRGKNLINNIFPSFVVAVISRQKASFMTKK